MGVEIEQALKVLQKVSRPLAVVNGVESLAGWEVQAAEELAFPVDI